MTRPTMAGPKSNTSGQHHRPNRGAHSNGVPEHKDDALGAFIFPAPNSAWHGPDPLPLRSEILNSFQRVFDIDMPIHHTTRFTTKKGDDVYAFLAHEALNAHSEDSPSQDMDAMGVLVFPRLHHLNLHGYEAELESELHQLCDKETTSKEQLDRLRVLLRNYCKH